VRAGWVPGGFAYLLGKKDKFAAGLSSHQPDFQEPERKTAPGHAFTKMQNSAGGKYAAKSHLRTFRKRRSGRVAGLRCVRPGVAELWAGGEKTRHIATGHACQPNPGRAPRRSTI